MMAQDFHDLTGQVIARVADAAHKAEASLLQLLMETRPAPGTSGPALAGPAIRPSADAVSSQGEVDDLLESLGF
jgi:chemotaxis protein CheZ